MKAGVTLEISIQRPSQWKPFTALWNLQIKQPALTDLVQTVSSWRVAVSTTFTLNYTERFGESPDGIPTLVLGVKGLISCSWFEERNCFCVCISVCVCVGFCHDEPWCWKPLANTSEEKWSVSPTEITLRCVCVCVFRLGSPAYVHVPDRDRPLRNWYPTGFLMCNKAAFFIFLNINRASAITHHPPLCLKDILVEVCHRLNMLCMYGNRWLIRVLYVFHFHIFSFLTGSIPWKK